jgi:O-antigen ligase
LLTEDQKIAPRSVELRRAAPPLSGAFFWLSAFYVVYCARPEDWIPVLGYLPLAKITGVFALLGLLSTLGRSQRKFFDLPRESNYLLAMTVVLFMSALFSPVWKGGALNNTLDFAKVWIVWVLTFMLVTDFARLRRVIYIQTASVGVISVVSVVLGHNQPRLEGVLGGIYSNPNDLAFAIVLTLPFALAFLLSTKRTFVRLLWTGTILVMGFALFRTASRAGFISLVISGAVCLWYFGVKGRRFFLIVASGLTVVVLLLVAGGTLTDRLAAFGGNVSTQEEERAYGSYEERRYLNYKALEGIESYPVLGLGVRNFETYSGVWKDVHNSYLQIAVEGGIPSLILYLLFFASAFSNLRKLRRVRDLDAPSTLFVGALHSSMIGFVVGALFAPVAYQFFPYFSVAYTSALLATVQEGEPVREPSSAGRRLAYETGRSRKIKPDDMVHVGRGSRSIDPLR